MQEETSNCFPGDNFLNTNDITYLTNSKNTEKIIKNDTKNNTLTIMEQFFCFVFIGYYWLIQ